MLNDKTFKISTTLKKSSLFLLIGSIAAFANILPTQNSVNKIEKEYIQSVIPNTHIEKFRKSFIDGFYSVFLKNGQILYVNPFKNIIFIGDIFNKGGFDYTKAERLQWQTELMRKKIKTINVQKLTQYAHKVVYGKGSQNNYAYVFFTDPECPYCQEAERFMEKHNATLYVNLFPLKFMYHGKIRYLHPHSHKWALQILSSKNFDKTFNGILNHNYPTDKITPKAKKELETLTKLGNEFHVKGTPMIYVINTKTKKLVDIIEGANLQALNQYLLKK